MLHWLIFSLARLLRCTYRFRYQGVEHLRALEGRSFILAIWHQTLMGGILAQFDKSFVVIISRSKDAEPVAYVCRRLGHVCVRGSSRAGSKDKGGHQAKEQMIEVLRSGMPGAITVDGPKGPAFRVKPGIIEIAKQSGAVIVPYTLVFSSYWEFKSWDRFRLPLPFSKILVCYDTPIDVAASSEGPEELRVELERRLNAQTALADAGELQWQRGSCENR